MNSVKQKAAPSPSDSHPALSIPHFSVFCIEVNNIFMLLREQLSLMNMFWDSAQYFA